jgi:hypothetical protein
MRDVLVPGSSPIAIALLWIVAIAASALADRLVDPLSPSIAGPSRKWRRLRVEFGEVYRAR